MPIVPLLLVNTLILETSPVAGSSPYICIYANDWEFSVSTYVGVASYVNENEEESNPVNVCTAMLWLLSAVYSWSNKAVVGFNIFLIVDTYGVVAIV